MSLIYLLNLLGAAVFAVSGVLAAARKNGHGAAAPPGVHRVGAPVTAS